MNSISHGRIVRFAAVVLALLLVAGCQSGPPPTEVELGEAALVEQRFAEAAHHFERALGKNPNQARALHGLSRVKLLTKDPEGALALMIRLEKAHPDYLVSAAREDYAQTLMTVGRKRLRVKQSAGALRALRALAQLDPAYRGLSQTLGKALEAEALRAHFEFRPDAALSLYLEALEVDPSLFKSYVGAAELLITAKKKKRALDLLTQGQRHHPGNTQIQAMTLEAMGLYKGRGKRRGKGRRGGPARRR